MTKKTFTYIFIAFSLLSLVAVPRVMFAQFEDTGAFETIDRAALQRAVAETAATAPLTPKSEAGTRTETEGCSLNPITNSGEGVLRCAVAQMANLAMKLTSYLLWAGGAFLNLAMTFTLDISSYSGSIEAGWKVLRDLINVVLIFGLLWIAIQIILNRDASWKSTITSIILAALFINFSLFFTKVIIDASNIVALQFYTSITGGTFTPITKVTSIFSNMTDSGISDQFMDRLKIITIFDTTKTSFTLGNIALIGLFGSIFVIITAAVFFIAGLMLVARTAILLLLMLTSPVGFAGTWFPRLKAYHDMWWKNLVDQSLFAPAFLILTWGVLKITEVNPFGDMVTPSGAKANFASALTGNVSSMGIIFNFLLMIALIIAALKVAKDLSGSAGKGFAGWSQKALGTVAFGGSAFLARQTAGRGFARLAESQWLREMAGKGGVGGRLAMLGLRGAEGVAKSNMDIRNINVPGTKTLKAAGVQVDFGKGGGTGGFRKAEEMYQKERIKEREAQAKLLEFKETDEEKKAREAAGDRRTAKEITAERQKAFAAQLKTPPKILGVAYTRPFGSSIEADIQGAKNIEKKAKGSTKLDIQLTEKKERYLKTVNDSIKESDKKIKSFDDVEDHHVEEAKDTYEKEAAEMEAKQREALDAKEKAEFAARAAKARRMVRGLENLEREIDRLEDKIDKAKKDSEGNKKREDKEEQKEDKKE